MMHVPEVAERGCARVLCYPVRRTTTLPYVRPGTPGRDSIIFMSLVGRFLGRDRERRNSGGRGTDEGPDNGQGIFDGRSVICRATGV